MGKGSKIIGVLFLVLGIACIGMYFVIGDKFTNSKVVFDSDGGTFVSEQIIKKGDKAVKPTDPTKENNEFIEWRLDGVAYNFDNIVSNDITLKAAWNEIINHNVKVVLEENEYTATIRDGKMVNVGDLNIPMKDGFLIKFYQNEGEEFDINTPIQQDIELTAKYVEIKYYTIKFNSNGGTKVADMKVAEGEVATEPEVTKDGYTLDGWYLGEEKFDFTTQITKDLSLKARWNDGPRINVIFMIDDTVYKIVPTKENTTVNKPSNPTKDGFRFVEWRLNGNAFDFKTKITSELTLTAYFEEATDFKVTFNSDGGSSVASQKVKLNGKANEPSAPTKSGYKFVEWQLNGKKYDFNSPVTNDIKLKAYWEKENPKFTVRFNDDEDKEITTQIVEKGATVKKPTDPIKDGYEFKGWLYNHVDFDFTTPITQDIILTARFERVGDIDSYLNESLGDQVEEDK